MPDAVVEEVRKAREEYARQFNFDLDAICADLQRREKLSGRPVVSLPKRPPIDTTLRTEVKTKQTLSQN